MNFLPFVFTFLLLLTFISSFLFSSLMGTARENRVILSQHKAYLTLLSDQNEKLFKSKKIKKENETDEKKEKDPFPPKTKNKTPKENKPEPRSVNDGCDQSKFNLYHLIHESDPQVKHVLEQTAIRLIEILYEECDFYKPAPLKDIAHTIVHQIMSEEFESLEKLQFENDEINEIYYKMLRGTNTGYPALSEYFYLKKKEASIHFKYALKPVMRAALGEELAKTVFDLEKKQWQQNNLSKTMLKKDFLELHKTYHASLVPQSIIGNIFNFDFVKKDFPQIHQEKKIRAIHKIESEQPTK